MRVSLDHVLNFLGSEAGRPFVAGVRARLEKNGAHLTEAGDIDLFDAAKQRPAPEQLPRDAFEQRVTRFLFERQVFFTDINAALPQAIVTALADTADERGE